MITALQKDWCIKQIDFSNAFVQADLTRNIYVSIPAMFKDFSGLNSSELCLKLNKSLYGLKGAPKLWHDWLAKALVKAGFTESSNDPGIYYGRGIALAVYVDDVLLFGPDSEEMKKVIKELQLQGFELKIEKDAEEKSFNFFRNQHR